MMNPNDGRVGEMERYVESMYKEEPAVVSAFKRLVGNARRAEQDIDLAEVFDQAKQEGQHKSLIAA